MVERLAAQLGAAPDWHWGGEQEQLEALEHYRLDLVAVNLDSSTPWTAKVGLIRPYYTEETGQKPPKRDHVVATPPGENAWLKEVGVFFAEHGSEVRP